MVQMQVRSQTTAQVGVSTTTTTTTAPTQLSLTVCLTELKLFIATHIFHLYLIVNVLQRSQMEEAQDMFRNANKVTRPEKALILGFMAGSRGDYNIFHYDTIPNIKMCVIQ